MFDPVHLDDWTARGGPERTLVEIRAATAPGELTTRFTTAEAADARDGVPVAVWAEEQALLGLIADTDRLVAWAQAQQSALILALDARRQQTSHTVDEVAVVLRITRRAAEGRLALADALASRPVLAAAMQAGRIDARKARDIADAADDLAPPTRDIDDPDRDPDPVMVEAVIDDAIVYGAEHTPTELAAWLRRRTITFDPKASEDRRLRKHAQRGVSVFGAADGMAWLSAYGPAHLLGAVVNTAHAAALAVPAAERDGASLDNLTFDALVELVRRGAASGFIPGALGRRAQIVLVADPPAASAAPGTTPAVAELAGIGAVPGSVISDIMSSRERVPTSVPFNTSARSDGGDLLLRAPPDWQISTETIVRSSGRAPASRPAALGYGPSTCDHAECVPDPGYTPSRATRRAVTSDHPRCAFPGCRHPAITCDQDHTIPWPDGPTCEHNLAPLCRRHHQLKTLGIWVLQRDQHDGTLRWTSPAGVTYAVIHDRDWTARAEPGPGERRPVPNEHDADLEASLLDRIADDCPPDPRWTDFDPRTDDPWRDTRAA